MTHTVTITKLDHAGCERISYQGALVYADEQVTVVRCLWQAGKPFAVGSFALASGDIFVEHYFSGQPFNIMRVYRPTGEPKGAYCNVTAPAEIGPATIRWIDRVLDLLVLPDGTAIELDRDELDALGPDVPWRLDAEASLKSLQGWLAQRRWPLDMRRISS